MLRELDVHKRLLLQKDQKLKAIKQKLAATESEILKARENVSLLMSQIDKYKVAEGGGKHATTLMEDPEILRELVKIKDMVSPKDLMTFLKMLLQYAENRSLNSGYGRDHPHLVQLILKNTIRVKPFKLFYAKYKNDPKAVGDFKTRLLIYFDLFQI